MKKSTRSSSYATGGGGTTFEHRVAARYLAMLLTGESATELEGRPLTSVAFQQSPRTPVDDLLLRSAGAEGPDHELAVAVRRKPNFVPSDGDTQELVARYVQDIVGAETPEQRRWALVVAGDHPHARAISELAALARDQIEPEAFYALFKERSFSRPVKERLEYLTTMVASALRRDDPTSDDAAGRRHTWQLLARFSVAMPRLEAPDESDRQATVHGLTRVARGKAPAVGASLLDRLEVLAAEFAKNAAVVERAGLRRRVHSYLEPGSGRSPAWKLLLELQALARDSVSDQLRSRDGASHHIDRSPQVGEIIDILRTEAASAVIVHGESGVGKSSVGVAVSDRLATDADSNVLLVNLRQLPATPVELAASLGEPLGSLLLEMSAPVRVLAIDAADAAAEDRRDVLVALLTAARATNVKVLAIVSTDALAMARELLAAHVAKPVERRVEGLTDEELKGVATAFPQLDRLAANDRAKEILRRLVVVDLLVRSDVSGIPLSEDQALRQIWSGLIRAEGRSRGSPDARERVALELADHELRPRPTLDVLQRLDAAALDQLKRDGVVRSPSNVPWDSVPSFAHDEIRRYAVAWRLMVDRDPAGALREAGVPRWALPAARLACQLYLGTQGHEDVPLEGRIARLLAEFEDLVKVGGPRWSDAPLEALLALGDARRALSELRPLLSTDEGLERVLRISKQRHQVRGLIDPAVLEPVAEILLEGDGWRHGSGREIVVAWLRGLAMRATPGGHATRVQLRDRLVAVLEEDERAHAELEEASRRSSKKKRRSGPSRAEQVARERPDLFGEIGFGPPDPRPRRAVPLLWQHDDTLELLALLGPDLDERGERVFRRVAEDAPHDLVPALERPLAALALAAYGRGLLADLTRAYYFDDEDTGSWMDGDGIRDHDPGGGLLPLSAPWRGPFLPLLRSDPRAGIEVINGLLNHAARSRARVLADLGRGLGDPAEAERYSVELRVSGAQTRYWGDDQTWSWYRGNGTGPYPCMSALQALAIVCDELIRLGSPLDNLIGFLLRGCESLAMLGLVVGVLVRHIEQGGRQLDPYLEEPYVWNLEFGRVTSEQMPFAASRDGLAKSERLGWSLREVAMLLALNADEARASELKAIGERLIAKAREQAGVTDPAGPDPSGIETVRGWASVFDRENYRLRPESERTVVEFTAPPEVETALKAKGDELQRGQEGLRLLWRYLLGERSGASTPSAPVTVDELVRDLEVAKSLLEDPPAFAATNDLRDGPAAVAAAALSAHAAGSTLPADALQFVAETLVLIAEDHRTTAASDGYFEQGADRSAARALPLLLLPVMAPVVQRFAGRGGRERVIAAGHALARSGVSEVRLHLARGCDVLWETPCDGAPCHHAAGLDLVVETMRDCVLGKWDGQQEKEVLLSDPVESSLAATPPKRIRTSRLGPAIRGLGSAASVASCAQQRARTLLGTLLDVQLGALLAHEGSDHRGQHALAAARALLALAAAEDEAPLFERLGALTARPDLLAWTLRGLAAAAEERASFAEAAERLWPKVVTRTLDLARSTDPSPFGDQHYGDQALAALMPSAMGRWFMYQELKGPREEWRDPLRWRDAIEQWISVAAGRGRAVDALIAVLQALPGRDQARTGLPWIKELIGSDSRAVAQESSSIVEWLTEMQPLGAKDPKLQQVWQAIVDDLTSAGETRLARYSE